MKLRSPFLLLILSLFALSQPASAAELGAAEPATPPSDPKKFELYLLVGQSNMAGRGQTTKEDRQPVPRVLVLNKANEWESKGDPIHFDKGAAGTGLGLTFGRLMAEKNPEVTIGLIPCAVGGTPIARWQPGQDLYEAALVRAKVALKTGTLKGILWHQGESESGNEEKAKAYSEELSKVVKGFRDDLNAPDVPFVAGELGEFLYTRKNNKSPFAKVVNEEINKLPKLVPNTAAVPSSGLDHKGDELHFSAGAMREFGKRYFEAMEKLQAKK